jgi:CBS domain-containing protein
MKVSEVMTPNVVYCREEDSANTAAQLMWENNCGSVPIVGDELKLIGILTDRDICMAAYTQGLPLGLIRVRSAMAREPISLRADDDISTAHRLMRTHRIRRLPVVDDRGGLSGMLALCDIARAAQGSEKFETEVGKTLAAISRSGLEPATDTREIAETAQPSNSTLTATHHAEAQIATHDVSSGSRRAVEPWSASPLEASTGSGSEATSPGHSGLAESSASDKSGGAPTRSAPRKRRPRQR